MASRLKLVPLWGLGLVLALHPAPFAAAAAGPRRALQAVDTNVQELAAGINAFGNSLFEELAAEAKAGSAGLILSPFSVAQALGMLLNGAEPGGASYDQLLAALNAAGMSADTFNALSSELSAELVLPPAMAHSQKAGLRVDIANSAWLKKGLQWLPAYEETLATYYNASLEALTTADAVNKWVSDATQGKIDTIVNDEIVQQAVLLLVNAVYFKGGWAAPFNNESTAGAPFALLDGGKQQSAMMYQQLEPSTTQVASMPAYVQDAVIGCAAVRLPFEGWTYSAIAAMPTGNLSDTPLNGQLALDTKWGPVAYADALSACRKAVTESLANNTEPWPAADYPLNLYLPRFEIEFFATLNDALQALNVTQPFLGGDLTQMVSGDSTAFQVTDVLHKVYEKVWEGGVEAAAVTAIAVGTSAPVQTKPPQDLRFDRPFVFDLVHDESGLQLFNGEIYKPEKWGAAA